LYTPPNFEQESNNFTPEGIRQKTRDRLCALDDAHARVAPYAHHLRIVFAELDDLKKFEELLILAECKPSPIRLPHVDTQPMEFFSQTKLDHVQRWIEPMDWKVAFQIEAYLRCGLLNTQYLLSNLREPIEKVIDEYGNQASELLRLFSVALRMLKVDETPIDCLARVRSEHCDIKKPKPHLAEGNISCHHVIITPSRILLEAPYTTQSNRVIRRYQSRDPTLAERFIRVEFRDEDHLAYRWDGDVDGTSFLQMRVGGILREGFKLGGRTFEFLGYSMSALREHSVWFVSPFHDPVEGHVTGETIRSSLGDFSKLLRTPSKLAARIGQAFAATDRSIKIRRNEWDEQPELGPHTDGVGTISPELSNKIWAERCRVSPSLKENRVQPSAYQFRFLGYKGVWWWTTSSRASGCACAIRSASSQYITSRRPNLRLSVHLTAQIRLILTGLCHCLLYVLINV
jgi:RNA-dependent RNA polymerase